MTALSGWPAYMRFRRGHGTGVGCLRRDVAFCCADSNLKVVLRPPRTDQFLVSGGAARLQCFTCCAAGSRPMIGTSFELPRKLNFIVFSFT